MRQVARVVATLTVGGALAACSPAMYMSIDNALIIDERHEEKWTQVECVIDALEEVLPGSRDTLSGMTIRLESDEIKRGEGRIAYGVYYCHHGLIRVWSDAQCLAHTSLPHELVHHIQFVKTGVCDVKHATEAYWGTLGYRWQVEILAAKNCCGGKDAGD